MEKKLNELFKIDQDFSLQLLKDEFKGETAIKEDCVSIIEIMNKHNEFFKERSMPESDQRLPSGDGSESLISCSLSLKIKMRANNRNYNYKKLSQFGFIKIKIDNEFSDKINNFFRDKNPGR
jgi:hypothetical protein